MSDDIVGEDVDALVDLVERVIGRVQGDLGQLVNLFDGLVCCVKCNLA